MASERPTVKLTEDEVESLVEAERRYRPERDEKLCADAAPVAAEPDADEDVGKQRPRKRTVRMRVFNFRPLARPHDEYSVEHKS